MQVSKHLRGFDYDIVAFALTMSAIIAALSIIGWVMLCREKKAGKYFLLLCHIPSVITYSIGVVYFLTIFVLGLESYLVLRFLFSLMTQLLVSVAAIVLQHFWTRYIL